MRALVLLLAACGRIGFDASANVTGDADPPIADAATFNAPCDVSTMIGTGDVATPLGVAALGSKYRITWVDGARVAHLVGVDRTNDAIAVRERTYGPSAFLPTPTGADVEIAGDHTVLIVWGTTQTEVRLVNALLGTARSTAYGALITDLGRAGDKMFMLLPGNDLRAQTVDPAMLTYSPSVVVEAQMTSLERVAPMANGAIIVAARPNSDDCSVWTFSSELAQIGFSAVPSDPNSCDEIVAASSSARRVIAYGYLASPLNSIRAHAIDEAATPSAPTTIASGVTPRIASGGTTFRIAYVATSGRWHVVRANDELVTDGDIELVPAPLRQLALASNSGEVFAVWATTGTPNEIWIRRFCGA